MKLLSELETAKVKIFDISDLALDGMEEIVELMGRGTLEPGSAKVTIDGEGASAKVEWQFDGITATFYKTVDCACEGEYVLGKTLTFNDDLSAVELTDEPLYNFNKLKDIYSESPTRVLITNVGNNARMRYYWDNHDAMMSECVASPSILPENIRLAFPNKELWLELDGLGIVTAINQIPAITVVE